MADTMHNDAHHQHSNPWPFAVAAGLTVSFIGAIPLLYGLAPGWILAVAGVFLFIVGLLMWLITMQEENRKMVAGTMVDPMDKKTPIWAVGFVVLSEVFLFGALFACYFYLHDLDIARTGSFLNFFVHNGEVFEVMGPIVIMNTVLLVSSSITLQIGESFLAKDRIVPFRILLAVTILLGLVFLGGQIAEYSEFGHHEFYLTGSGPFGTLFYAITGLHGLHVSAGVLLLIYLLVGSFRGQFSSKHHKAVTTLGIYWHFVDVVWIFLVFVLYLRVF